MDIQRLLHFFIKKYWVVLLITAIGGVVALYLSISMAVPKYQAESTLVLQGGKPLDAETLIENQLLLKSYSDMIYSDPVVDEAMRRLSYTTFKPEDLRSAVTINSQKESGFVTVIAEWTDPENATLICRVMSSVLAAKINEVLGINNIIVIDDAKNTKLSKAITRTKIIGLGVLAGFLLGLGIIYLIALLDKTVQKSEEIEENLGIKVIGIIPEHSIK